MTAVRVWTAIGSDAKPLRQGYKYRDRELDQGPCKSVLVKGRKSIKATCLGRGPTTDFLYDLTEGTDEGIVNGVLTIGEFTYCTAFDDYHGIDGSDGRMFLGRDAPAPSSCPAPPSPSAAFLDATNSALD